MSAKPTSKPLGGGWRHPAPRLVLALLLLALSGASITALLAPGQLAALSFEFGLTLVGVSVGLWAGRRVSLAKVAQGLVVAAAVLTALLWSPLGVERMAAHRHVAIGPLVLQPSVFWVVACHATAALVAVGHRSQRIWLAAALLGAGTSALAMPELSIVPQVIAGLLVVTWSTGRRKAALLVGAAIVVAVAASALIPYVRRRWIGFLDPDGHARGAGYDYRALRRLVAQAQWFGPPGTGMPRSSSPADDYWLAAAMWKLGRIPMLAWLGALGATLTGLWRYRRPGPGSPLGAPALLCRAIVAGVFVGLVIHAGYNLGLWPISAISAPLSGISGGVTAVTLFGLCFGTAAPLEDAPAGSEDATTSHAGGRRDSDDAADDAQAHPS